MSSLYEPLDSHERTMLFLIQHREGEPFEDTVDRCQAWERTNTTKGSTMLGIAENYLKDSGGDTVEAACDFACDLMRSEEETLKAGYSFENAVLSAFEAFSPELTDLDKIRIVRHVMASDYRLDGEI